MYLHTHPQTILNFTLSEGTKLPIKQALLHFRFLYLWPDGSSVRYRLISVILYCECEVCDVRLDVGKSTQ